MAARFKAIQERKLRDQAELQAVTDALRQAEDSRKVIARAFDEKRAHDLLSQAQSRMEGTMISPREKANALERVKGVGEYGLVRQFPSPSTEVPVGSGFVLPSSMPKPAVMRPQERIDMFPKDRSGGVRMYPAKPAVQPGGGRRMFPAVESKVFK